MATDKLPKPSEVQATPMRMVLAFSGSRWKNELPGVVIRQYGDGYNVLVLGDETDAAPFNFTQAKNLQLFDPLTPEQRAAMLRLDPLREWAEWNTHQKGQAAKAEELAAQLAKEQARKAEAEAMARLIGPPATARAEAPTAEQKVAELAESLKVAPSASQS